MCSPFTSQSRTPSTENTDAISNIDLRYGLEDVFPHTEHGMSASPPPYTATAEEPIPPRPALPPPSSTQQSSAQAHNPFPTPGILEDDDEVCKAFCAACTCRRSGGEFNDQFDSMLAPLRCWRCKTNHPRIMFDSVQRLFPDGKRICINYSSRVAICEHYEAKLPEQDASAAVSNFTCTAPACRPLQVKADILRSQSSHSEHFTMIKSWTHTLPHAVAQGPWLKLSLRFLRLSMSQRPKIFCSHMAKHTERFFSPEFIDSCKVPGEEHVFRLRCPSCTAVLTLLRQHKATNVMIHFNQTMHVDTSNLANGTWANLVSLESTGLAQDPELKYITWCLDPTCETTKYGTRLSLFLKNAHNWMDMRSRYVFNGRLQLDYVMSQLAVQREGWAVQNRPAAV